MCYLGCFVLALAAGAEDPKAAKKDPVAEVFSLPPGARLGKQQQAKYGEIKQFYEPKLREALEKVGKAAEADKHKAYTEMKKLRDEVDDAIVQLLKTPDPATKPAKKTTTATPARPTPRYTPRPSPARATPARAIRARPVRAPTAR